MSMKYEEPKMEVKLIEADDVVRTSEEESFGMLF